jgi:osmoprotectant transport system permease protein
MDKNRQLATVTILFITAVGGLTYIKGIYSEYLNAETVLYLRSSFAKLALQHFTLVASSGVLAITAGLGLGIFVTRSFGRQFLPVVNTIASLGQTIPPVAVLALSVPAVGFGAKPTIIALFCYGVFPIVRNTITGIESVPQDVKDAAKGLGMSKTDILKKIELPLSMGVIMAGVRTSVIINIGTATIGATIGAGGFGAPIISGLINNNFFYVLEGGVCVGLMAVMTDMLLMRIQTRYAAQDL